MCCVWISNDKRSSKVANPMLSAEEFKEGASAFIGLWSSKNNSCPGPWVWHHCKHGSFQAMVGYFKLLLAYLPFLSHWLLRIIATKHTLISPNLDLCKRCTRLTYQMLMPSRHIPGSLQWCFMCKATGLSFLCSSAIGTTLILAMSSRVKLWGWTSATQIVCRWPWQTQSIHEAHGGLHMLAGWRLPGFGWHPRGCEFLRDQATAESPNRVWKPS